MLVPSAESDEIAKQLSDIRPGKAFMMNPSLVSPTGSNTRQCYDHATEICRTLAALGPAYTSPSLAGVAFVGAQSSREKECIRERTEYIKDGFLYSYLRGRRMCGG